MAVIGGGWGIGLEVARRAALDGAKVHLGGRTSSKLAAAAEPLGATWQVVDSTDQDSLAAFFGALDRVDHLFTPGASYVVGPLRAPSDEDAASPFETKFWGQYHAVSTRCLDCPPTPRQPVGRASGRGAGGEHRAVIARHVAAPRRPRVRTGRAVLYLVGNGYTTGSTLYPDGGYALR
ncbi:MAG: hypothetical protein QOI78_1200 [Actinomycetota bacterium]|nr:hypothetical protein [Actinomycetota bacterium]